MTTPTVSAVVWSRDFVRIDGDTPLQRALEEIGDSTASTVVVRLSDGRLFVFLREELLESRRLRTLRLLGLTRSRSIAAVLRLDAANGSRFVRDPDAADEPRRPSEPRRWSGELLFGVDLGRCAERLVLVDAERRPLAVAGPGIGERAAHRGARPQAPPAAERPREAAAPAPEPEQAAAAPSPRHTGASATTGDDEPDEDELPDDDAGAVRHPSIEPGAPPRPGKRISLTIDLTRTPTAGTSGDAMHFESQDPTWETLEIGVHVVCPAVVFDAASGTITVKRNADSVPAVVHGTVDPHETPGAAMEVSAVFMHAGRFAGTAMRRLTIEAADAPVVVAPPPPRAADAPPPGAVPPPVPPVPPGRATPGGPSAGDGDDGTTKGALRVEVGAEPPDLTVQIMVPNSKRPGELHWLVMPRELFDELPASLEGGTSVGRNADSFMAKLFTEYAELERGKHRRRIEGFGENLWKKVPSCFQETYWAMWDRYQRPLTIQFISAEPNLPWELMRPSRPGTQHDILAVQHPVARWIASYRSYLRNRLPAGGLCTIAPRYASVSAKLARAELEAQRLVDELGARRVDGTYDAVLALLEATALPSDVSLLHFAGHGRFAADAADSSTIKLEDGSLAVSEVAREAVQLGVRCRTVVFFNACEVGATGAALGALGGWADAFLGRRFGGFIAPLWAVDDEDAAVVSAELLDGIIRKRRPVGAVLQGIRAKYGDVSPTFFSYLYYGDVTACIGSGAVV